MRYVKQGVSNGGARRTAVVGEKPSLCDQCDPLALVHTEAGLVIECLGSNGMGTASKKMAGQRAVERCCCRGREEVKVCRGEVVMLRRPSDRSVRSPASHGRTADQTLAVGTAQRSWTFDIQGSGRASQSGQTHWYSPCGLPLYWLRYMAHGACCIGTIRTTMHSFCSIAPVSIIPYGVGLSIILVEAKETSFLLKTGNNGYVWMAVQCHSVVLHGRTTIDPLRVCIIWLHG